MVDLLPIWKLEAFRAFWHRLGTLKGGLERRGGMGAKRFLEAMTSCMAMLTILAYGLLRVKSYSVRRADHSRLVWSLNICSEVWPSFCISIMAITSRVTSRVCRRGFPWAE
jgi:hypothetical protein